MAMSKKDRDAEIQRLAMSALDDLEALGESLRETVDPESGLSAIDARLFDRACDHLARAKVLIEASK